MDSRIDRSKLRDLIMELDEGGVPLVPATIEQLQAMGVIAGIHVGRTDLKPDDDETVEWYAGQLLGILENEAYFAVNSIINCLERFCPLGPVYQKEYVHAS